MLSLKPLAAVAAFGVLAACGGSGSPTTTDVTDLLADGALDFSSGPAASADPGDRDVDFATILNGLREIRGLPDVTYDSRLDAAAQKHAQDLVDNDYFSHTSLNGDQVRDRIQAEGYDPRGWAENLARGYQTQGATLQAWIDSPGHNDNLNATLEEFALGVAGSGNDLTWVLVLATER